MKRGITAVVLAAVMSIPALGMQWSVTNPDPSLAGATIVEIENADNRLEVEIHKWWLQTLTDPGSPASGEVPITIRMVKEAGDPDVLHIIDEIILNVSPTDWYDYHVFLIDPLAAGVSFVNVEAVANADMVGGQQRFAVQDPVSPDGAVTGINFYDGMVGAGDWLSPPQQNQLVLTNMYIDWSDLAVGEFFLLKQIPTVPEPATGLLLLGAAVMIKRRR